MAHVARAIPADGGLRKRDLLDALDPAQLGEPLTRPDPRAFGANVIDLVSRSGMAISMQTGRAKTNNEGLVAVLAAAAMPAATFAALILPERYKGSSTAPPVERDVRALAGTTGISLALHGVLILTYGEGGPAADPTELATTVPSAAPAVRTPPRLTDEESSAQINWTREEILLACDLVRENDWWELRPTDTRVVELSRLLQVPFAHPVRGRPANFRNPNSVSRKTADLMTRLPHYEGRATKGGRLDGLVLDEFLANPVALAEEARDLRDRIRSGEWGAVPGEAPVGMLKSRSLGEAAADTSAGTLAPHPPAPAARAAVRAIMPDGHEMRLARAIVESRTYREQHARSGRHALADGVVEQVLAQLVAGKGRVPIGVLAAAAGSADRSFDPAFAALRRLLNVDGYDVVSLEPDLVTVRLDLGLVRDQFAVEFASEERH